MKTSRLGTILIVAALVASFAFAHGSKDGRLLGTVKMLHENHLVVTSTDGHDVTVTLTDETELKKGDGEATRDDLVEGARLVVQLAEDGKTAVSVKVGVASE